MVKSTHTLAINNNSSVCSLRKAQRLRQKAKTYKHQQQQLKQNNLPMNQNYVFNRNRNKLTAVTFDRQCPVSTVKQQISDDKGKFLMNTSTQNYKHSKWLK